MRHATHAPVSASVSRHARRWRRMRARLGFAALWVALLVWALGASLRVPGEDVAAVPDVAVQPAASASGAGLAHADMASVDMASVDVERVDLERAAAWPAESADAAPSHEPLHPSSHASTAEQDAALYIAGR